MQPSFLRLLGLTTAAVFALPLEAQEPGPNPSVAAAWQRFQQDTGGRWLVQWCAPTGTPQMVYGHGLALADWRENSLDEARRQANAQLAAHADLLGLGASDFTETIGARMGRTWTFTFAQRFAGLPVIGGRVDVRIHMSGKLVHLGSTAWPIPADFATLPTIGEAQATALAWTALDRTPDATPQPAAPRAVQLVVWGDASATAPTAPVLAWEVPISAVDASGNGPIGRVYVHRSAGEICLMDIALLPPHRGRGLGSALIAELVAEADAAGLPVTLHVERENPAQRLYARHRFRLDEEGEVYQKLRREPQTSVQDQLEVGAVADQSTRT